MVNDGWGIAFTRPDEEQCRIALSFRMTVAPIFWSALIESAWFSAPQAAARTATKMVAVNSRWHTAIIIDK
jgi:hypothetical protein